MNFYEVTFKGKEEDYGVLVSWLLDHDVDCFREETASLVDELNSSEIQWDYVDDNLLRVKAGELLLQFFPSEEEEDLIKDFEDFVQEGDLGKVSYHLEEGQDFANNWKKYYKPFDLGENLSVVPHWMDYSTDRVKILMDPGMAFGSGSHETTYLCLEKLEKYVKKDALVYDVGCGSGILSVASVLLGAKKAMGVDIDPVAIDASKNNASLNGVEDQVDFKKGDLLKEALRDLDLIVSNLFAEIIESFAGEIPGHLKPGGIFIGSGILSSKLDHLCQVLEKEGLEIIEKEDKNGWSVLVARV